MFSHAFCYPQKIESLSPSELKVKQYIDSLPGELTFCKTRWIKNWAEGELDHPPRGPCACPLLQQPNTSRPLKRPLAQQPSTTLRPLKRAAAGLYETTGRRRGRILSTHARNRGPLYECNQRCACPPACPNRLVQHGQTLPLDIKSTIKGQGVFAGCQIEAGAFVCEYAGEVLSTAEARKRLARYDAQAPVAGSGNFLLVCLERFGSRVIRTSIDPTLSGNVGRFINHSCDPNLVSVAVRVQSVVPHVCFFARRAIAKDEELSFDYGSECGRKAGGATKHGQQPPSNVEGDKVRPWALRRRRLGKRRRTTMEAVAVVKDNDAKGQAGQAEQNQNSERLRNRVKCLCGASCCRGFLPFDTTV